MLKAVETVLVVLLAVGIYGGVPALMLWGWARWFGRTQPRTVPVILSLIGFTLATASGLLAVSSGLYAHAISAIQSAPQLTKTRPKCATSRMATVPTAISRWGMRRV